MPVITAIKNYFIEAYQEISKVVWPTRETIIRYTILVVILSLLIAAFLGGLDLFFKQGIEGILAEKTNF
jgi:preprotein translocase SecE subunit